MIVVKKSSKKSQHLRNCGHSLGRTFLLFHPVRLLETSEYTTMIKKSLMENFTKRKILKLIMSFQYFIVFTACSIYFANHVLESVKDYCKRETGSRVQLKKSNEVDFPEFSICPSQPYNHGYTKSKKYQRKLPLKSEYTWWYTILACSLKYISKLFSIVAFLDNGLCKFQLGIYLTFKWYWA